MEFTFGRGRVPDDVAKVILERHAMFDSMGMKVSPLGFCPAFPRWEVPLWMDHAYKIRWPNGRTVWVGEPYGIEHLAPKLDEWCKANPKWRMEIRPDMALWLPTATTAIWLERVAW